MNTGAKELGEDAPGNIKTQSLMDLNSVENAKNFSQ